MWNYEIPKIWLARIPAFWDRTIPMNYPNSSSEFSLSFGDEETRSAVLEMEANLGTEESIITEEILPENCVLTGYVGTYDVLAESGVETLLSPERVDTENVIAMHYAVTDGEENGEWVQIEDVEVRDGYVWGTLTDFSPIAIFTYKKGAHIETSVDGLTGYTKYIVAEGNPIKVYFDEADEKIYAVSAGIKEEITDKTLIIGGSVDGTPIESTSVAVTGLTDDPAYIKVIAGSVYVGEGSTTVGSVYCQCKDTIVGSVTGSYGAVRTDKVNFDFENITIDFFGCGEGYRNIGTINPTFAGRCWAKDVTMRLVNVISEKSGSFLGQNCEYFYVHNTYAYVEGGSHHYLIMGGSNDGTNTTKIDVVNAKVNIFQTTNRGNVADAVATFKGCDIKHLYVGGDASDSTVTGTTGKLKYEIKQCDHGSYNIENGTEAGQLLTANDVERIVDSIKVSRSAEVTIAPELLNILGAKYIVK